MGEPIAETELLNGLLLPCPFCGTTPKLADYYGNYYKQDWCVHCEQCDLSLDGDPTPGLAAARWNTRAAQQDGVWQPIETAPKDGTIVLLASTHERGSKGTLEASWWSAERCANEGGGEPESYQEAWYLAHNDHEEFCRPTHWRRRLTPPRRS